MEEQPSGTPDAQPEEQSTDLRSEIDALKTQIHGYEHRIKSMEQRQGQQPMLPQTNLISSSFLSRAFAVFGHNLVASLIIILPLYLLIFIIIIFVGVSLTNF
ncbi:MAG: hypothetical protein KFH87_13070 [Bacteroidetes bacterium]|nr:hypothetical protein [Bacteroidota bacterium]